MNKFQITLLVLITMDSITWPGETQAKTSYKYEVAICAIFRDDARFLKEWIEFHRTVGVEHFWLYNNLSCDDYLTVLIPYIEDGIVDLIEWPYENTGWNHWLQIQIDAYNDCINKTKMNAKWLALIDTDEFLFPVKKNTLPELLKDYKKYGGVCANWQMFGTSGVKRIPDDGLMIENLVRKAVKNFPKNRYFKSIVRPDRVRETVTAHNVNFNGNYYLVNERRKRTRGQATPKIYIDKLRINHYWTRDEDFFFENKIPRRNLSGSDFEEFLQEVEKMNEVEDKTILRFVPALKHNMSSR